MRFDDDKDSSQFKSRTSPSILNGFEFHAIDSRWHCLLPDLFDRLRLGLVLWRVQAHEEKRIRDAGSRL